MNLPSIVRAILYGGADVTSPPFKTLKAGLSSLQGQ